MSDIPAYKWVAVFEALRLCQFDEKGRVHYFNEEVLPYADQLLSFWLIGPRKVGVDLRTGDFEIDGVKLPFRLAQHVDVEYPIQGPLRPIFFRRTTRQLDSITGREVAKPYYVYATGWQATVQIPILAADKKRYEPKEVNVKHILYVHPDGTLVFG